MRKFIVLILLFSVTYLCNAQSTKQLDEKFGFNKFVLGSTVKQIKSISKIIKISSQSSEDLTWYSVKDMNQYTLFNYNINQIILTFYKEALMEISVEFKGSPVYEEEFLQVNYDLVAKIEKEYGIFERQPIEKRNELNGMTRNYIITGKKVTLLWQTYPSNSSFIFINMDLRGRQLSEAKSSNGL